MCSRMKVLFQPEPGTEQALMRKKINIHLVNKKCIGSCILKWGQCEDRTRSICRLPAIGTASLAEFCALRKATFAVILAQGEWLPVMWALLQGNCSKDNMAANRWGDFRALAFWSQVVANPFAVSQSCLPAETLLCGVPGSVPPLPQKGLSPLAALPCRVTSTPAALLVPAYRNSNAMKWGNSSSFYATAIVSFCVEETKRRFS